MKTVFKAVIKFIFAGGIIWWLYESDKIDLGLLIDSFTQSGRGWLFAACFAPIILLFQCMRWRDILATKYELTISTFNIFKVQWISVFFNSFLPGSVSGDFVKIFYVKNRQENLSTKFLLGSIIVDRLIGLASLIIIVSFATLILIFGPYSSTGPIQQLIKANLLLLFGLLIAMIIFYTLSRWPSFLAPEKYTSWRAKLLQRFEIIWADLQSVKKSLPRLILYSIIAQALFIIIFWLLTSFLGSELTLLNYFVVVPIGLLSIAIPIAPSGLGVGHLVFQELFQLIGFQDGANIFNIYFLFILIFNLSGSIPYVLMKKKPQHITT